MFESLLDTLPMPQRLALAYAPAAARAPTLALLSLDIRLGQSIRQASEPIMAQMRLAWWRDQLNLESAERVHGDELLTALACFSDEKPALQALVDGWELLLSDVLDRRRLMAFASARGGAFAALARVLGSRDTAETVIQAGQRWALADLLTGLSTAEERDAVITAAEGKLAKASRLSRKLRPLTVLDGLARRCLLRGGGPLLDSPSSGIVALRLGLFGR